MAAGYRAHVRLIDGFEVHLSDRVAQPESDQLPRGVQRLVARLCLSGRPPRSCIAGQLWPDVPEDHAHASLRSALWRLQKVAPGVVEVSAGCLSLAAGVRVDVTDLNVWAGRVRNAQCRLEDVVVPDVALRGELLPGWDDDWVLLERERLRQLRMHALEQLATRLTAAGRYGDALQAAYAAVRAEPLRESAHRTVVRVHAAEGNVTEALRAFEQFRVLLADELGIQPSEQMAWLVQGVGSAPGSSPALSG